MFAATSVRGRRDVRKVAWIAGTVALMFAAAGLLAVLISAAPSPRNESNRRLSIDRSSQATQNRQVYSPIIANDPYVIDQWEKSIQALEAACAKRGEFCVEARQARRSVNR
jgi:hypothetical protein